MNYENDYPEAADPMPPRDERTEALERVIALEQEEKQARHRADEAAKRHAKVSDDLHLARDKFMETLRTRGLIPTEGSDFVDGIRDEMQRIQNGGAR